MVVESIGGNGIEVEGKKICQRKKFEEKNKKKF